MKENARWSWEHTEVSSDQALGFCWDFIHRQTTFREGGAEAHGNLLSAGQAPHMDANVNKAVHSFLSFFFYLPGSCLSYLSLGKANINMF